MSSPSSRGTAHRPAAAGGARSLGSCYGYAVHSALDLAYLREGTAGDRLEVRESDEIHEPAGDPTFRWVRRHEDELEGSLYVEEGAYRFWSDREGWFTIDPAVPSITVPATTEPLARERRLWGVPAVLCFLRRGDLSLHAAAVEVDGGAILLAAPGRFGKTTLAGGFLRTGHRVLSEDISCCRLDGEPLVFPGPAVLRVRRDAYERLGFPGTTLMAEEHDRVHLAFDPSLRGDGAPVPIRAVVFLRASDDRTSLERLDATHTLPDLWALSWKLPVEEDLRRCFRGTAALADRVPVWNLHRSLRFDGLEEIVELVVRTCG